MSKASVRKYPPDPVNIRKDLRCFDPGRWLMIPRVFYHVFGASDSLVLSYLIDKACRYRYLESYGGWFYASPADIEWDTGFGEQIQKRIINRLADMRVIERKRVGSPPKRYIRILIDRLDELCDKAESKREAGQRRRDRERRRRFVKKVRDRDYENGGS